MAVGFWKKLGEVAKKVWTGVKTVYNKVVAPVAKAAAPIISAIPHPVAQAVGAGLSVATPIIERLTGGNSSNNNSAGILDRLTKRR